VLGIDGATLRVAEPMLREGRLPHLAELARKGASGPLRSILPLRSPRIWTSVATGKLPEKHGILNFFYTQEGRRQLYRSTDRSAHALWNIASDRGLRVGVVNWWTTFPPERINGVMISDHFLAAHMEGIRALFHAAPAPDGPVTHPAGWIEELPAHLDRGELPPAVRSISDPFAELDTLPSWVAEVRDEQGVEYLTKVYRDDALLTRLALAIESELQPDVLMVLLLGIDRVSHILWACLEPAELYPDHFEMTASERRAGAEALRLYYEYTDQLVGALLERFGAGDTVIVLSDHGFEADVSSETVTGGHKGKAAIDGLLFARGPGIPAGISTQGTRVTHIAPTVLRSGPAPFLELGEQSHISSYDGSIEYVEGGSSGVESQIIERLRALGYGD
jgi:predicted AlkP superfamily phosphohydrolase/phosphomutase